MDGTELDLQSYPQAHCLEETAGILPQFIFLTD